MNAEEFVNNWKSEKDHLLKVFTGSPDGCEAARKIASLDLSKKQQVVLKDIIDTILTDTFYTLLLGLDGEANIGGTQHNYKILDEDDNIISPNGEIESEAWQQFHEDIK